MPQQVRIHFEPGLLADDLAEGPAELFAGLRLALHLAREEEPEVLQASQWARSELVTLARIHCERGELDEAERTLARYDYVRTAEQQELAAMFQHCEARVLRALGRPAEALAAADASLARTLGNAEKDLILEALRSGSPRREVAERLGISPRTLRHKLARLREAGVEVPAA